MSRAAILVPWALAALLAGALGAMLIQRQDTPPAPTTPWYCTSPAALAKFQQENPTLGVMCP